MQQPMLQDDQRSGSRPCVISASPSVKARTSVKSSQPPPRSPPPAVTAGTTPIDGGQVRRRSAGLAAVTTAVSSAVGVAVSQRPAANFSGSRTMREVHAEIIDARSVQVAATVPAASRGYDGGRGAGPQTAHRARWSAPGSSRSPPRISATGTPRRPCCRGCAACTATPATPPWSGAQAATPAPSSTRAVKNSS